MGYSHAVVKMTKKGIKVSVIILKMSCGQGTSLIKVDGGRW